MSPIRGWLTPEARAGLDAVLAKLAAPGMCNPEDDAPTVDGAPAEESVQRDTRSTAQRNHDGLNAGRSIWHPLGPLRVERHDIPGRLTRLRSAYAADGQNRLLNGRSKIGAHAVRFWTPETDQQYASACLCDF
jgi:hypothetical protein